MTWTTKAADSKRIFSFGNRMIGSNRGCCRQRIGSTSSSIPAFSTSASPSESPSPSSWVTTEHLPDDDRIAILRLHRKPANALSLEMCTEISRAIRDVREENRATAMVVTSGLPSKIFSAGLDIPTELYRPDPDRLPLFWKAFQQVFLDLYGCQSLTTLAALEGPAPAAGCMLALSCDYRVAASNAGTKIGLNESHLGIVAPPWMCQQYIDVLGHRRAELALLAGTLFPPDQALKQGLVDEVCDDSDKSNVDENGFSPTERAAIEKAREFVRIPQGARAAVKELTRQPLIDRLSRERERDVDFFCNFVTSPKVQQAIGVYLEALAKKSSQKK